MSKKVEAYKNHRQGSAKGTVHKVFDSKGKAAAVSYGKTRKLKASTLNQWTNTWARESRATA
jgi:hypothetical protein